MSIIIINIEITIDKCNHLNRVLYVKFSLKILEVLKYIKVVEIT